MNEKIPLFRVISDLDDTIKITNTPDKLATVYRGMFRSSAFTGMAELFQEWHANAGADSLHIVSSSPLMLKRKIERFLERNGFPKAELRLRNWVTESSVKHYKKQALEILASRHQQPLVLLGDDSEFDPEIMSAFQRDYPRRVAAVYMHQVRGRPLREGLIPFFTAFDIACAEVHAKRLSIEQATKIGKAVLEARKTRRLIPHFSAPLPLNYFPNVPEDQKLLTLWGHIQKRLLAQQEK